VSSGGGGGCVILYMLTCGGGVVVSGGGCGCGGDKVAAVRRIGILLHTRSMVRPIHTGPVDVVDDTA
jgi:hypothetical protein